ncbi:flagellar basal body P-ring formation chaperone FlgA [Rhodobacter sp. 24-YEA-8]|uniref:flagellar basal body P-ring formation chaperone FlgA n=1 Tax=Rhodobacter sp. 24-YEA-8 TaxID=1884310 RepID=UPI00089734D5|nr:flagellar basal body P-ring formation chaperone FlgA [Rhodobacter sp. 24-YEA-8]SEC71683.1 flagella basal body P-ring formation protein FlgA [Rhodobacter sp. 24-YEA-8]
MLRGLARLILPILIQAGTARAESLVAARNLPAQTIIAPGDLMQVVTSISGALTLPAEAVGQETRVAIYAGRPVRPGDIGPPALIERNSIVALEYRAGGLVIRAEGRALARGGAGEMIRVMNLASKTTVSGRIGADGLILVGGFP